MNTHLTSAKQFSPACERNRAPILAQLRVCFAATKQVLEIGSGTGQHAVHFAQNLPHLRWHTSDRSAYHASIEAWLDEAQLKNLLPPFELDVTKPLHWPTTSFDAAFTANTCHIMAWEEVQLMMAGLKRCLDHMALLVIYGPFKYQGEFTSESNAHFDHSLRQQASHMGIRDIEEMTLLAQGSGFHLLQDIEMPANNRLLIFQKTTNES